MHIAEGVLSTPVLVSGWVVTGIGLVLGVKLIDQKDIPKIALLTSAFFLASLIHVPIGPSNAHLILNGLLGIILGIAAFPSVFIGLLLQAILFQFGGLTTLGINTANMALPGIVFGLTARHFITGRRRKFIFVVSWLCAFFSILGSGFLVALSLWLSGENFYIAAQLIFSAHIPVAIVEGFVTGAIITFLLRVKPEILNINEA